MASDRHDAGRRQRKTKGAHRKSRRRRSAIARTVAAGSAAICIGAAYELGTPSAEALSILLPGPTVDGVGTTTRINILEGNIFNPQLGILGGSTSNNTTIGNVAMGLGNNIVNQLLSLQLNLGGSAGNGNTTQINILSYNIFNPQWSLGPNVSNNTSVNNVAMGNGNNSTTNAATPGLLPWLGGAAGNGNTVQLSFLSGNIFNPQWSLFGQNLSHNTAITNVAIGNGNYSATTLALGGLFGGFLFGGGNGNTFQYGFFVSNIYNPQFSWGAGNISYNTAATNTAAGNGNNSTTEVTGGGLGTAVGGTIGNGNTTQVSTGSGNIINDQVNVGPFGGTGTGIIPITTVGSTTTGPTVQQLVLDSGTASATGTDVNTGTVSAADSDTSEHRNVQASTTSRELDDSTTSLNDTTTNATDDPSSGSPADSGEGAAEGIDAGATGATGGDTGDTGGGDSGDGGGGDGSS